MNYITQILLGYLMTPYSILYFILSIVSGILNSTIFAITFITGVVSLGVLTFLESQSVCDLKTYDLKRWEALNKDVHTLDNTGLFCRIEPSEQEIDKLLKDNSTGLRADFSIKEFMTNDESSMTKGLRLSTLLKLRGKTILAWGETTRKMTATKNIIKHESNGLMTWLLRKVVDDKIGVKEEIVYDLSKLTTELNKPSIRDELQDRFMILLSKSQLLTQQLGHQLRLISNDGHLLDNNLITIEDDNKTD